jgi:hypothetical protein
MYDPSWFSFSTCLVSKMIPSRIRRSLYFIAIAGLSSTATAHASIVKPHEPLQQHEHQQFSARPRTATKNTRTRDKSNNRRLVDDRDIYELTNNNEDQWMSLNDQVQFLPSFKWENGLLDEQQIRKWAAQQLERSQLQQRPQRKLSSSSSSTTVVTNDIYRLSPFIEGVTEYDEYQTAWRLLGFMIDCDDDLSIYSDDDNHGNSGSGSGDTGEGCHRYVIWAAVSLLQKRHRMICTL